jgi:hypothetical protein
VTDRKRPCPEVCSAHVRFFSRFYHSSSRVVPWLPDVTEGHLTALEFPWVCACAIGSCATPVVTEDHVNPSEVLLGCSLRRPRPITIGTSIFFFFHIVSIYIYRLCITPSISTLLRVHLKLSTYKIVFFSFYTFNIKIRQQYQK